MDIGYFQVFPLRPLMPPMIGQMKANMRYAMADKINNKLPIIIDEMPNVAHDKAKDRAAPMAKNVPKMSHVITQFKIYLPCLSSFSEFGFPIIQRTMEAIQPMVGINNAKFIKAR